MYNVHKADSILTFLYLLMQPFEKYITTVYTVCIHLGIWTSERFCITSTWEFYYWVLKVSMLIPPHCKVCHNKYIWLLRLMAVLCGKRYIRRQNNPVITTIREKDRDRVIDGQTTNQVEIEFIWRTEWTITKPCIVRVDSKTWHAVPYSEWIKDNTLLVCSNLGLFKAFQSRSIIHG